MKCILCEENETKFLDKYKFNINSDIEFFGNINIYFCKSCNFSFCNPMPEKNKLTYYYENIYRSKGRPHELHPDNIDSKLMSNKNLNYLQYLSTFIKFKDINKIFDFGSGTGDIGYLLKKQFDHLELYSSENDNFSKKILKKRGYQNFTEIHNIDLKFDLILSVHSLEHLTDFKIINFFKKISKPNSFLFLEVPNCPIDEEFLKRPYDSPHLMFFSKESFIQISKKFNLDLINLNVASYSIKQHFKYMERSKKKFENWKTGKNKNENYKSKLKKIIKKIIPKHLLFYRRYLLNEKNSNDLDLDHFTLNKPDSWCLRGLFKFNNL